MFKIKKQSIERAIDYNLKPFLDSSVEEAMKNVNVDLGNLRNSIGYFKLGDGNYRLVANTRYAQAHERGSRPHWTSVRNLFGWAERKLGDAGLAYALQRHIAEFGTNPHPFMKRSINKIARKYGFKTSINLTPRFE